MKKVKLRKETVTVTLSPSSKQQDRTDSHDGQDGTGAAALSGDVQKDPDGKSETSRDHNSAFMRHVRESVKKNHKLYKLLAE